MNFVYAWHLWMKIFSRKLNHRNFIFFIYYIIYIFFFFLYSIRIYGLLVIFAEKGTIKYASNKWILLVYTWLARFSCNNAIEERYTSAFILYIGDEVYKKKKVTFFGFLWDFGWILYSLKSNGIGKMLNIVTFFYILL
jgi:hypothetical protein